MIGVGQFDRLANEIREIVRPQSRARGRPYAADNRSGQSIPYGSDQVQATIYVTTVAGAQFPEGGEAELNVTRLN